MLKSSLAADLPNVLTDKQEVLSPEPHHNLSHQNSGQISASTQKLRLGKDSTGLGSSPIKELCGPLSNVSVSLNLKCELSGMHKYAIHILTGTLTYYMLLKPEFPAFECPPSGLGFWGGVGFGGFCLLVCLFVFCLILVLVGWVLFSSVLFVCFSFLGGIWPYWLCFCSLVAIIVTLISRCDIGHIVMVFALMFPDAHSGPDGVCPDVS